MEKFIKIEDAQEFMEDAYEDGLIVGVETVADLYLDSCDTVIEILMDEGLTLSERTLIAHVLELQSEILNELIKDEFDINEIEPQEGEIEIEIDIECDEDCETCSLK